MGCQKRDGKGKNGDCRSLKGKRQKKMMRFRSLQEMVDQYTILWKPIHDQETRKFAALDPQTALSRAAGGRTPSGDKKRSHAYLVNNSVLAQVAAAVKVRDFMGAPISFPEFYAWIRRKYAVKGFGELSSYDFAEIAWSILRRPSDIGVVYTKRGTGKGVRALERYLKRKFLRCRDSSGSEYIKRDEFPSEFSSLTSSHIENMLCIYKDCIPL